MEFYVTRVEELIPLMLSMSAELKMCAIVPAVLLEIAQQTEDKKLKQKLKEVGLNFIRIRCFGSSKAI